MINKYALYSFVLLLLVASTIVNGGVFGGRPSLVYYMQKSEAIVVVGKGRMWDESREGYVCDVERVLRGEFDGNGKLVVERLGFRGEPAPPEDKAILFLTSRDNKWRLDFAIVAAEPSGQFFSENLDVATKFIVAYMGRNSEEGAATFRDICIEMLERQDGSILKFAASENLARIARAQAEPEKQAQLRRDMGFEVWARVLGEPEKRAQSLAKEHLESISGRALESSDGGVLYRLAYALHLLDAENVEAVAVRTAIYARNKHEAGRYELEDIVKQRSEVQEALVAACIDIDAAKKDVVENLISYLFVDSATITESMATPVWRARPEFRPTIRERLSRTHPYLIQRLEGTNDGG